MRLSRNLPESCCKKGLIEIFNSKTEIVEMGKFGTTAVIATNLITSDKVGDPIKAWAKAALAVFPDSESSRQKGCPKNAYLGLCEDGLVRGVMRGNYTSSNKNKGYALEALHLLKSDSALVNNHALLWKKVMKGVEKKENNQMDVVISLFQEGYLEM